MEMGWGGGGGGGSLGEYSRSFLPLIEFCFKKSKCQAHNQLMNPIMSGGSFPLMGGFNLSLSDISKFEQPFSSPFLSCDWKLIPPISLSYRYPANSRLGRILSNHVSVFVIRQYR